jgi:hypothetical protein
MGCGRVGERLDLSVVVDGSWPRVTEWNGSMHWRVRR